MNNLIIKNKNNRILATLEEWEKGFIEVKGNNNIHWKDGKSAFSLGKFFTSENGLKWLNKLIYELFGETMNYEDAEIEHESKLDSYRGGQRMQDLAIWGSIHKEKVFIAIEAKVLESFGKSYVKEEYENAIKIRNNKPNSKQADRIEEIVNFLFPGKTPYDQPVCNLRYQLMHYFTASIREGVTLEESKRPFKERKNSLSTIVLPILVFKTQHYCKNEGDKNKNDYINFVSQLRFELKQIHDHRMIYYKKINECDVYTIYEEIDLL